MQRNDYAESLIELLKSFNKASRTVDMLTKSFNGGWRKTTHCPHRKVIVLHPLDNSAGGNGTIIICRKNPVASHIKPVNCPRCKIDICPLLKEVDSWLI
jgi:hypothetical protein